MNHDNSGYYMAFSRRGGIRKERYAYRPIHLNQVDDGTKERGHVIGYDI